MKAEQVNPEYEHYYFFFFQPFISQTLWSIVHRMKESLLSEYEAKGLKARHMLPCWRCVRLERERHISVHICSAFILIYTDITIKACMQMPKKVAEHVHIHTYWQHLEPVGQARLLVVIPSLTFSLVIKWSVAPDRNSTAWGQHGETERKNIVMFTQWQKHVEQPVYRFVIWPLNPLCRSINEFRAFHFMTLYWLLLNHEI